MFTLGDAGGNIALGEAGGIGTSGDDGVIVRTAGCEGTMLGSAILVTEGKQ